MTDSYADIADALRHYAETLHAAWAHPSFAYETSTYRSSSPYNKVIVTQPEGDAATRLPQTGRLVRGAQGVTVEAIDAGRSDTLTAGSALHRASAKWRQHPPLTDEEAAVVQSVKDAEVGVTDAMSEVAALRERSYDIGGFKNYDMEEVRRRLATEKPTPGTPLAHFHRYGLNTALYRSMVSAMEEADFDPQTPDAFNDWEPVIVQAVASLRRLAERETWTYDVVALLNAPTVDHPDSVELVETSLGGQVVTVMLEAATDDLLTQVQHREYNLTGVGRGIATAPINAALRYRVQVPVDASMQDYVGVLERGADLFTRVVDVLRLVREDDLGIVGVESFAIEPEAPTIRHHYDVGHNPTYASVTPRRSYFFLESAAPLSDDDLGKLRRALPPYLSGAHAVQGLDVAIRRHRDSRERHRPGEPESLLDLAIALEALLLNDSASGHGELGYRLALRAARLVGGPVDVRKDMFSGVRDLYAARSKLAHGQTLDTMKERDARRVRDALGLAPPLLQLLLLRFLTGAGPSGLRDQALADWWRNVELGDGSPLDEPDPESTESIEASFLDTPPADAEMPDPAC